MFELAGSEFHRGILQIEAEKAVSGFRRMANSIGPVRARFISIGILAFALFLSINRNPSRFLFESGYAASEDLAMAMQIKFAYGVMAFGVLVHILLGFWRREFIELEFDKTKQQLRFYHQGSFHYSRPAEGMVPFREIGGIQVVNEKVTKNSVGYVELRLPEHLGAKYSALKIALLSDEQMRFYPLNLYRLTGILPKGDWTDPDDELVDTSPKT